MLLRDPVSGSLLRLRSGSPHVVAQPDDSCSRLAQAHATIKALRRLQTVNEKVGTAGSSTGLDTWTPGGRAKQRGGRRGA